MKRLLIISVGLLGAIAPVAPVAAQIDVASFSTGQNQSQLLMTDPLTPAQSKNRATNVNSTNVDRLNQVAKSIHAKSDAVSSEESALPNLPIPKDLFRTPSKLLPDSHPLEVFQTYKPDPSLGINFNGL